MTAANLDAVELAATEDDSFIREDVMQRIHDISGISLPFTDLIGSDRHTAPFTEWLADRLQAPAVTGGLAAATPNAREDGSTVAADDFGLNNQSTFVRLGNHSQISTKNVEVSTRANAVGTHGFQNTLAYQTMMRQSELRRDVEADILANKPNVAPVAGTPSQSAGLEAWLDDANLLGTATAYTATNSTGTAPVVGGWSNRTGQIVPAITYTTNTPGALTEDNIKDVVEVLYQGGANPSIGMTTTAVMRRWSEFQFTSSARIATLINDAPRGDGTGPRTAQGAANIFSTDFGITLTMLPNRLQPTSGESGTEADTLFIFDPTMIELSFLSGYQTVPLRKTGLADLREIFVDYTLKVLNPETLGAVFAISRTTAMTA